MLGFAPRRGILLFGAAFSWGFPPDPRSRFARGHLYSYVLPLRAKRGRGSGGNPQEKEPGVAGALVVYRRNGMLVLQNETWSCLGGSVRCCLHYFSLHRASTRFPLFLARPFPIAGHVGDRSIATSILGCPPRQALAVTNTPAKYSSAAHTHLTTWTVHASFT